MYVWDETHATNNFAIMTKLILQYIYTTQLDIADQVYMYDPDMLSFDMF